LRATTDSELDVAFETVKQQHIAALAVTADPFFDTRRDKLVALAASHEVPTIYHFREYSAAGGPMSYGNDSIDTYRQAGVYTGRTLKGANPVDLPVMKPTKFEFVINLKTAKTLGLEVAPGLLAIADEVIE
jgi:putative ABC transport system substrate-binding protein